MTQFQAKVDARTQNDHVLQIMSSPSHAVNITRIRVHLPVEWYAVRLVTPGSSDTKGTESVPVAVPFRLPPGSQNGMAVKLRKPHVGPLTVTVEFEEDQPS